MRAFSVSLKPAIFYQLSYEEGWGGSPRALRCGLPRLFTTFRLTISSIILFKSSAR